MAPPRKHDYDSDEFYTQLHKFASVCALDKDVALLLDLAPDVFGSMKNGNYAQWTEPENQERSARIQETLNKARVGSRMSVWSTMLRLGLGAQKVRSTSVRTNAVRCSCNGRKKDCVYCNGTGWTKSNDEAVITETETDVPPSLQAITLWLYHHDPDYRKCQKGEAEEDVSSAKQGINIMKWIDKEIHGLSDSEEELQD